MHPPIQYSHFFFFNDTATTEIYTLSLHDALPILPRSRSRTSAMAAATVVPICKTTPRSEEHTSELQSHLNLVCRLLLEKKKQKKVAYVHNRKENLRLTAATCSDDQPRTIVLRSQR